MTSHTPQTEPEHLLDPRLPYDMTPRANRAADDVKLQQFVNNATRGRNQGRQDVCSATFGANYDAMRTLAGSIKQHALDHLDVYLERFIDCAEARGTHVHYAMDDVQARNICLEIARRHNATLCVKSKSMVTEEVHLLGALESAGIETIETDLGEFIIQLDGDAPSHIVAPMIHKDRVSVAKAFVRELDAEYTEDPRSLTMIARAHMREKFRQANLGISGANFLVADSGSVVICTNEGNADLSVSRPPVHIVMVGIEKIVPRDEDLSVFLKLLARSATSQAITVYTTIINGPRLAEERDGPEHVHVILVDNGRTTLLSPETRELLRCIRCGACLNACPVYRKVGGGHAYGAVYSGPIGATITPLLKGIENYPDLPQASSLCGACREACPVDIDIPRQLVALRATQVQRRIGPRGARLAFRLWAKTLVSRRRYEISSRLMRFVLRRFASRDSHKSPRRWVRRLPGSLAGWTEHRDFPAPAARSFRTWWRQRSSKGGKS